MALPRLKDTATYCSDVVYEGIRTKDAEASARHIERAKKALARRRERVKEDA
jgi:hypothetical protein